ncbi:hypothetical protein SAMN04489724_3930 [Algoriphagus locisalis]|uniref:Uncharacterized protein n=1 Tax=Algoriphagus locisalis TaxID=305507 RepID=A0A1I7DDM7_9BACT|nr:hypothetical protein [Algoriphagus locisalis]SFU09788.1 hypothetical protein SAMN04489724_3930 [Algoriphagus locisalis]
MFDFINLLSVDIIFFGKVITRELLIANPWYCLDESRKIDCYYTFREDGTSSKTEKGEVYELDWKLSSEGILEFIDDLDPPLRFEVKCLGNQMIVFKYPDSLTGLVLFTEEKAKEILIPFLN